MKFSSYQLACCTFFIGLLSLTACYKDKGNYEYVQIEKLDVKVPEAKYAVDIEKDLVIRPTVTLADGTPIDTAAYEYRWFFEYGANNMATTYSLYIPRDSIGAVFDRVSPFENLFGEFNTIFRVIHKQTKMAYDAYFRLVYQGPTYEGWLLLCDPGDGTSRLDMVSRTSNDSLLVDVLGTVAFSSFPMDAPPVGVTFSKVAKLGNADAWGADYPILLTEKHAALLSSDLFSYRGTQYDIANAFLSNRPPDYRGAKFLSIGGIHFLIYNQSAFCYHNNFHTSFNQLNVFQGAPFPIAPYIATISGNTVLFNTQTNTFMRSPITPSVYSLPMPSGTLFSYETKQDLRFMTGVNFNGRGEVFAVLDSLGGKSNLARFSSNGQQQHYYAEISNAPEFAQAKLIAVEQNFGNVLYAVGGRLYAYDFVGRKARLVHDYGERLISHLEAGGFYKGESIVVGTYLPTDLKFSGQFDVFRLDRFDAPLRLEESHKGMGKVVSVAYRYR